MGTGGRLTTTTGAGSRPLRLLQGGRAAEGSGCAAAAGAVDLERARQELQGALVRELGPFGEIAFEVAWAIASPDGRAGLARLVEALAAELDDELGRARFRAAARRVQGSLG